MTTFGELAGDGNLRAAQLHTKHGDEAQDHDDEEGGGQAGVGLKFEVGGDSTVRVSGIDVLGPCYYDVDVAVGDVLFEIDGVGVQVACLSHDASTGQPIASLSRSTSRETR
jgi:hypothetical protein